MQYLFQIGIDMYFQALISLFTLISAKEEPWGGLSKVYSDQKEGMFMFLFKCIKAVAFCPLDEMLINFNALTNSSIWDHRLDDFCNLYFIVSSIVVTCQYTYLHQSSDSTPYNSTFFWISCLPTQDVLSMYLVFMITYLIIH